MKNHAKQKSLSAVNVSKYSYWICKCEILHPRTEKRCLKCGLTRDKGRVPLVIELRKYGLL